MDRTTRDLAALVLGAALVLAGCRKDSEGNQGTAAAPEARPAAVVNVPDPVEHDIEPVPSLPDDESSMVVRVEKLLGTPVEASQGKVSSSRVDASTPQSFVESLQKIEAESDKERVDELRAALTLLQFQAHQRIAAMAAQSGGQPPQFTDEELMRIAFGEINGMTLDQVVAHARAIGPSLLDKQ